MTERRYTEEETAAIFRAAAEGPSSLTPATHAPADHGLTLGELQAIGREVGIAPDAVARAAQLLDVRISRASRNLIGLPIGVERRVTLTRRLSDDEWEQLVGELREVFKARGRTKSEGALRQWTNGNLYVLLEPTPNGQRIRLGSLHGGAAMSIRLGLTALVAAGAYAIARAFGADVGVAIPALFVGGAILLANGALRVPRWARLRARQMEEIAVRLALPAEPT
jgi:hypothetical protein